MVKCPHCGIEFTPEEYLKHIDSYSSEDWAKGIGQQRATRAMARVVLPTSRPSPRWHEPGGSGKRPYPLLDLIVIQIPGMDLLDSFIYSITTGTPSLSNTDRRVALQEFVAALDRKHVLEAGIADDFLKFGYERLAGSR